jgi:hypothetical protein
MALDPQSVLDHPLEEEGPAPPGPSYRTANAFDLFLNLLLLGLAAGPGLGGFLLDADSSIMIGLIGFFFLGIYQLLSSLVGGARGNGHKARYSIFAWLYTVFLFTFFRILLNMLDGEDWPLLFFFLFLVPGIGAVVYTVLCYGAWRAGEPGKGGGRAGRR